MKAVFCLIGFLVWTGTLFSQESPKNQGQPKPASFSVCWWNIDNFGETDRIIDGVRVEHAMKPPQEITALLNILQRLHPDLLGVAEVIQAPDDRFLKLLHQLLTQHGLDYPYVSTAHGEDQRIQIVLFSRFPIRSEAPFVDDTFPVNLKSASTGVTTATHFHVSRGFVNAQIEIAPGYEVQVMLAHLKSKVPERAVVGDEGEPGDAYVRFNEAKILRNHIDDFVAAHPAADLLVMGDFNDTALSHALQPLFGTREKPSPLRDLPLTDTFGDWWTHFYLQPKSYERIDYIFANPSLMARFLPKESYLYRPKPGEGSEFDTYAASDHRPLFAKFAVKTP